MIPFRFSEDKRLTGPHLTLFVKFISIIYRLYTRNNLLSINNRYYNVTRLDLIFLYNTRYCQKFSILFTSIIVLSYKVNRLKHTCLIISFFLPLTNELNQFQLRTKASPDAVINRPT